MFSGASRVCEKNALQPTATKIEKMVNRSVNLKVARTKLLFCKAPPAEKKDAVKPVSSLYHDRLPYFTWLNQFLVS